MEKSSAGGVNGPLVLDNLIPLELQDSILSVASKVEFPWYFTANSLACGVYENDSFKFSHPLFWDGRRFDHFDSFFPILVHVARHFNLLELRLDRFYAHLITTKGRPSIQPPHVDIEEDGYLSVLYYIHDSDGDTIFYNNFFEGERPSQFEEVMRVTPKKGRVVIFNSRRYHSSSNPVDNDIRVLLNATLRMI